MSRIIVIGSVLCILVTGILGCAGPTRIKSSGSDPICLDRWLEEEAFEKIILQLRTNSFVKDLPFIVVKARGEAVGRNIGQQIDALTEEIRARMVTLFLEYPEIELARRHPVSVFDRPYRLQELACGRFVEHKMLLTVDIKRLDRDEHDLAKVNIRAVDLKNSNWIKGFSLHKKVLLTPRQSRALDTLYPDEYLRGLKHVPFLETQRDEMAAYLARNLSCIFNEAYTGNDIKVYVDSSKIGRKNRAILWFQISINVHAVYEITIYDY